MTKGIMKYDALWKECILEACNTTTVGGIEVISNATEAANALDKMDVWKGSHLQILDSHQDWGGGGGGSCMVESSQVRMESSGNMTCLQCSAPCKSTMGSCRCISWWSLYTIGRNFVQQDSCQTHARLEKAQLSKCSLIPWT